MMQDHKYEPGFTSDTVIVTHKRRRVQMTFRCTAEQFRDGLRLYNRGALMPQAFPFLTPTERDFLMTGFTAEEQAELYGENED